MAVRRPTAINPDNFPRGRGPYGGSSCPALNEEVLLADNKWIPSKDLKVGDKVATHLGSNKVTHIDVLKDRIKKEVVFSDNDKEESIVTSDSHPYYVQNEEGFVEVKDLKVGDQVGNFKVKEIKDADKGSVVHISIDEAQTYYLKAGDKKVLSHNKSIRPPKKPTIEGMPISQLPIKTIGGMPMPFGPRPFDPMFDPPRNQPRPFPRKPKIRRDKKRGGFLGKAFRRLQEQLRKRRIDQRGMPRMPGMGSPGGRFNPGNIGGRIGDGRMRAMPIGPGVRLQGPQLNFGMEQMPAEIDISALERLPMGEQPMPPMPQDLPEVESVGMMPEMGMRDMQPRMMMAEGDEVIDRSPEQELFSLQAQLENLQKQLEMDRSYNDLQTIVDTSAEIEAIQKRMVEIQMEMARQKMISENPYNLPFDSDAKAAREKLEEERRPALEEEYRSNPYNYPFNKISIEERKRLREQGFAGGDEVSFPDLTGDGKVTQADILKGRGVYAEGDEVMMMQGNEIESMLSGMDSEESGAMDELEQMAPEMEMIDQLIMMVAQMIQQGAGEEEVIMFLREQGLDDEDIGTVLQLVAEMSETEEMAEDQIGNELAQLG